MQDKIRRVCVFVRRGLERVGAGIGWEGNMNRVMGFLLACAVLC